MTMPLNLSALTGNTAELPLNDSMSTLQAGEAPVSEMFAELLLLQSIGQLTPEKLQEFDAKLAELEPVAANGNEGGKILPYLPLPGVVIEPISESAQPVQDALATTAKQPARVPPLALSSLAAAAMQGNNTSQDNTQQQAVMEVEKLLGRINEGKHTLLDMTRELNAASKIETALLDKAPAISNLHPVFSSTPTRELHTATSLHITDAGARQLAEGAVAPRIQWMLSSNVQNAELRLDPPELGSIEIQVNVSKDTANVTIYTQAANVKDALEASMLRLRELLSQSGIQLGQFDVKHDSNRQFAGSNDDSQPGFAGNASEDEHLITEIQDRPVRIDTDWLVDFYA